jgi:hypothetical protein
MLPLQTTHAKPRSAIQALQGSAWVQIESAAVEVDRRLEVLDVAEAASNTLDLLDLAIDPLAHRAPELP